MLNKPENWNEKFNEWLGKVKTGEISNTDCLDGYLDMCRYTYGIDDDSWPPAYEDLVMATKGRSNDATSVEKQLYTDIAKDYSGAIATLVNICHPTPNCALGVVGITFDNMGGVYIGLNAEYCLTFRNDNFPKVVHYSVVENDLSFKGWWVY